MPCRPAGNGRARPAAAAQHLGAGLPDGGLWGPDDLGRRRGDHDGGQRTAVGRHRVRRPAPIPEREQGATQRRPLLFASCPAVRERGTRVVKQHGTRQTCPRHHADPLCSGPPPAPSRVSDAARWPARRGDPSARVNRADRVGSLIGFLLRPDPPVRRRLAVAWSLGPPRRVGASIRGHDSIHTAGRHPDPCFVYQPVLTITNYGSALWLIGRGCSPAADKTRGQSVARRR